MTVYSVCIKQPDGHGQNDTIIAEDGLLQIGIRKSCLYLHTCCILFMSYVDPSTSAESFYQLYTVINNDTMLVSNPSEQLLTYFKGDDGCMYVSLAQSEEQEEAEEPLGTVLQLDDSESEQIESNVDLSNANMQLITLDNGQMYLTTKDYLCKWNLIFLLQ